MKDLIVDEFQNCVDECLLRHKSILDILTKLDESQSRINRSVVKCVTSCGCLQVEASKQSLPENLDDALYDCLSESYSNHIVGEPCSNCKDVLEKELGNHLFYLASICNSLDLNLYDILLKEYKNISTLGKYTLK
ncbi:hypothetical protein [Clostridium ihumii]|uniref:hypothetical protein n=1 Tax=Clostridium ihumii TaxID=1470356 RepID=UPI000554DEAB|nr:hypothetical protein [Clostridium ihumii]